VGKHVRKTPESCPVCGEDVPRNALACPECGADHNSGWRENAAVYDGVDLPSDEFEDDEELLHKEFGARRTPSRSQMIWWIAAVIVLLALVLVSVSSRW
jgi:predicted nucleic acid-binding Zn ribbon protein